MECGETVVDADNFTLLWPLPVCHQVCGCVVHHLGDTGHYEDPAILSAEESSGCRAGEGGNSCTESTHTHQTQSVTVGPGQESLEAYQVQQENVQISRGI